MVLKQCLINELSHVRIKVIRDCSVMYDEENLDMSKFQRNVDITNRAKTELGVGRSTPKSRVFQDVSSPVGV